MKKIAWLVILTMVLSFSTVTANAEMTAAGESLSYATSSIPEATDPAIRTNPGAAYGAPDALQGGGETYFYSLNKIPNQGTTFYFDNTDNSKNEVYNKITSSGDESDIWLSEVTWGQSWHLEGCEVWLTDAVVLENGKPVIKDVYLAGAAFNKMALVYTNNSEVVKYKNQNKYTTVGSFNITEFNFPVEVIEARGVKLVDITNRLNTPNPTNLSYKIGDDGFDLDAIRACTRPYTPYDKLETELTVNKFIDANLDGMVDTSEIDGIGFTFNLEKKNADGVYEYVKESMTNALGEAAFNNLKIGEYRIVEDLSAQIITGKDEFGNDIIDTTKYEQTNYTGGFEFKVIPDEISKTLTITPVTADRDGAPGVNFGNGVVAPNFSAPETAWAGTYTSDSFPKYNRKTVVSNIAGDIFRTGSSAWAMGIKVNLKDGEQKIYDLISGQYYNVGKVIVTASGGKLTVTYITGLNSLVEAHCGVYSSKDLIPGNNGALNGVRAGDTFTFDYSEGTNVYVVAHAVVAARTAEVSAE